MNQKTEEWHQARSMKISGSRIASINKTPGAFMTYNKMMQAFINEYQEIQEPEVGDYVQTLYDWGNDHEPDAEKCFLMKHGGEVEHYGFIPHPEIDYIGVSPDGKWTDQDGDEYLMEYKCPFSGVIPEVVEGRYNDQCQLGMEVMNLDKAILVYWSIDSSGEEYIKEFWIDRDPKWWAKTKKNAAKFWKEFLDKRGNQEVTITDPDLRDIANELSHVVAQLKVFKELEKNLKEALKKHVSELDTNIGNWRITHVTKRGTVDYMKVFKAYDLDPDDYRKEDTTYLKFTEVIGDK